MPADDEYEADTYVAPQLTPMVESPPIEPVEPPLPAPQVPAPASGPAREPAAQPAAPAPAAVIPPLAEPSDDEQLIALLGDLQRYSTLQNDDLKREVAAATQALARQRTDVNRVRLAVLYTLVRNSAQDDQRAIQLFENVAKNGPATSSIRQLAAVLHAQVTERQRAVRDEQQKADAAIQKLEALRAMERSLLRDRVRSGGGGGSAGAGGSGR
jgi:hypothetical protein